MKVKIVCALLLCLMGYGAGTMASGNMDGSIESDPIDSRATSILDSIMDVPTVPAQETHIVLAQAAAPAAGVTPASDFIFNVCKETESTGDPMSAMRGVNPVGMLAAYFENHLQRIIDGTTEASIKPILIQDTTHGKLNRHVAENGQVYYMYDPTPNYIGNDRAVFLAEFEGKRYKIVVELHVFMGGTPGDFGASTCPEPQLIKVTKPSSGDSGFQSMGSDSHGTRLSKIIANSLPFKGRVGVGMGVTVTNEPIPILAFPLKGKGR